MNDIKRYLAEIGARGGRKSRRTLSAEDARAAQEAPLELRKARERLKAANDAIENEDMESARRYAREAALLAELAAARTEMLSARRANKELENTTDMLKEEMQRGTGETS